VPVDKVGDWKAAFSRFLQAERKALIDSIENDRKWDDDVEGQVREAIETFNKQYGVEDA
jgi:F0F1-type ATP synthase alpha subunit